MSPRTVEASMKKLDQAMNRFSAALMKVEKCGDDLVHEVYLILNLKGDTK